MMLEIFENDVIVTADGYTLGKVRGLYRQPDPAMIDPNLKLFAEYLEIVSLDVGADFYIPTTYIEGRQDGRLILALTREAVLQKTLNREPQFVAHGKAFEVPLQER